MTQYSSSNVGCEISQSKEYQSFRSSVPLKKLIVDEDGAKEWVLYDAGPKSIRCPIIFLPPASGTADVYFRQLLSLTSTGYRVILLECPVYWSMAEWCRGFRMLLDFLHLDRVHIFGCSLGGYLAQKFAEQSQKSQRVASLILCNTFIDTTVFRQMDVAKSYWLMPAIVLKKMVMGNFPSTLVDAAIADSIDFMVERLDSLTQAQLASRLTLNCTSGYIEPQKLASIPCTLMDVFDECALTQDVRDEMYKCYPDARRAHLKSGGNFPFLSRSAEVNLIIQVHMKQFIGTKRSAKESDDDELRLYQQQEHVGAGATSSRDRGQESEVVAGGQEGKVVPGGQEVTLDDSVEL